MKDVNKEKKYFVPNYKNNLLSLFVVAFGYFLLALAFWGGRIAPLCLIFALICLGLGFALTVVRPTFCRVSAKGITLYYAFGFFRESGNWSDIKNVYDVTYRIGRTRDKEKVFIFKELTADKRFKYMKSEIEKNKKLGRLIRAFWGEPTVRDLVKESAKGDKKK